MADLKFIECTNRRTVQDIQSGELTDYMFMMYRKGEDGWYKNTLMPTSDFKLKPSVSAALCGLCETETVRVTLDGNGKASFISAEQVIASLNEKAKALGFEAADPVYAVYAMKELIKLESVFLSENSFLVAHLSLYSVDAVAKFPSIQTVFTITLEYREKRADTITAITDVMPCNHTVGKTPLLYAAAYRANAAAQMTGYDAALMLDAVYKKYIISLGISNVFVRFEDEVITPEFSTDFMSDTVEKLIKSWGITLTRRKLSSDEFCAEYKKGKIIEVFAVSVCDGVLSVTTIDMGEEIFEFEKGKLARKLSDSISNIESGILKAPFAKYDRI